MGRWFARWTFALPALFALAGCPSPPEATRDGGTPCSTESDCNPPGTTCGAIRLCVLNFCAEQTVVRACPDGAYPDSGVMPGECFEYGDCNPPGACGLVVSCIDFRCARDAEPLMIPCTDAGDAGGTGDATDARDPDDGGARDATIGD
jgi:hypothetical protein